MRVCLPLGGKEADRRRKPLNCNYATCYAVATGINKARGNATFLCNQAAQGCCPGIRKRTGYPTRTFWRDVKGFNQKGAAAANPVAN